jgi:hypothetical protein
MNAYQWHFMLGEIRAFLMPTSEEPYAQIGTWANVDAN